MKIFICQTPFQLFYANQIINYLQDFCDGSNQFLIVHSNLNVEQDNWWPTVKFENAKTKKNIIEDFFNMKDIIKKIDSFVEEAENNVEFFIPHIGGLLSNYVFFNRNYFNKPNVKINFFYEGVLYFYDFKEKFQKHHIKRILIATLLGFNYKFQKRILPYDSTSVYRIYTPIIELTQGKKSKIIEVDFKKYEAFSARKSDHFLILGGPVNFLSDFYHLCVKDILMLRSPNSKIFYKGHASFKTNNKSYQRLFEKVANEYNLEYVELESNIPIELMLNDIMPYKIYSYYSSALLNIKLMSDNQFEMLCCFESNNGPQERLIKIFQYCGIETVTIY